MSLKIAAVSFLFPVLAASRAIGARHAAKAGTLFFSLGTHLISPPSPCPSLPLKAPGRKPSVEALPLPW